MKQRTVSVLLIVILIASMVLPWVTSAEDWFEAEHEHAYFSYIAEEPGCETAGVETFECDCGDTYSVEVEPLGHSYQTSVVKPSCDAEGYTVYRCERCGISYTDDVVPALGHVFKNGICTFCGVEEPVQQLTEAAPMPEEDEGEPEDDGFNPEEKTEGITEGQEPASDAEPIE
ncbi:MAG: hypothetical protein IKE30_04120, partial [Clostridia bacterium]|nr:hypothetical protein [Clostridia bacterium]